MDKKFQALTHVDDLSMLNGHAFEEYLKQLFTDLGYHVEKTPGSGDFGADLVLVTSKGKTVVQAKQYADLVGFDSVKEISFAQQYYEADEAWVVCTSDFTAQAVTAADKVGVKLFNGEALEGLMTKALAGEKLADDALSEAERKKREKELEAERQRAENEKKYAAQLRRIRGNFAKIKQKEDQRLSELSNLEVAIEFRTFLGQKYIEAKRKGKEGKFEMSCIEKELKSALYAMMPPNIYVFAEERFEKAVAKDCQDAIKRFGTTQAIESYAKRVCKKDVNAEIAAQDGAIREECEKRYADIARKSKEHGRRAAKASREKYSAKKQEVLNIFKARIAAERRAILKLAPEDKARVLGLGIGDEIRELRRQRELLEEKAESQKNLERQIERCRKSVDRLNHDILLDDETIASAEQELAEVSGKPLSFFKSSEKNEIKSRIAAGHRSKAEHECQQVKVAVELDKSTTQLHREQARDGNPGKIKEEMKNIDQSLDSLVRELAAREEDLTIPNVYEELAKEFKADYRNDPKEAVRTYGTKKKIEAMADLKKAERNLPKKFNCF